MKSDAFHHAEGTGHSPEYDVLLLIERFGVEAITGRKQLYFGELKRMICAENIIFAYGSRKQSLDWAVWAKSNPSLEKILIEAEKLCR